MRPSAPAVSYRTDTTQIDIGRLKAETSMAHVAALVTPLASDGGELTGACPFHEERRPSFQVDEAIGRFHCRSCGRTGDVVAFVQGVGGRGYVESCEWLTASKWTCPPDERDAALRAMAERQANMHRAKELYRQATPVSGTSSAALLAERGFQDRIPGCIRHAHVPAGRSADGGPDKAAPALIAAAQDVDGAVTGVACILHDGSAPRRGRISALGQIRGSALRLAPVASELVLTSGVENGLALSRMHPGESVWAALDDGDLPHVELPSEVRRLVLCGKPSDAGRRMASEAKRMFERRGLQVTIRFPSLGASFREEMMLRS